MRSALQASKPSDRRLTEATRAVQPPQSEMLDSLSVLFYFMGREGYNDDAFTVEGLTEMCNLHNTIITHQSTSHGGYDKYCRLENYTFPNGTSVERCAGVTTPLVLFYANEFYNVSDVDLADFDTPNFDNITRLVLQGEFAQALQTYPVADANTVAQLITTIIRWSTIGWQQPVQCNSDSLLDPTRVKTFFATIASFESLRFFNAFTTSVYFDAEFSLTNLKSRYTRAFYFFYGPLCLDAARCYDNIYELTAEQENIWEQWWCAGETSTIGGACDGVRDFYDEDRNPGGWVAVQPTPFALKLLASEFFGILLQDGLKTLLPVVLTFVVVWIQVGSLLLAFAALAEMLMSFFATFFFYSAILGIRWMSFYAYLSLYIILAIGADDVFVFMDAWKQSFYMGAEINASLQMRMAYTYRRAGLAMLITSFTTAFAFFFAAITAPIAQIQATCIFAGFVILVDYIMVMTWFTGFVVIYHNYFEMKPGMCCACCDPRGCESLCDCSKPETTTEKAQKGVAEETKLPAFRQFFKTTFPFDWLIKLPGIRFGVIVFFIAAIIPFIVSAAQVEASTQSIQFLPDWHPFQRFLNIASEFGASQDDQVEAMQIVWGMDPEALDTSTANPLFVRDARNMSDADFGTLLYSADFRFDEAAQQHIKSVCDTLPTYSNDIQFTYSADGLNQTANVNCFINAWESWLISDASGDNAVSFPVPEADAAESLVAFINDGNQAYANDVGFGMDANGNLFVRFAVVRADSNILSNAFYSAVALRVFYTRWETILGELNDGAPASAGNAWQTCGTTSGARNMWIYMVRQETYIQIALQGVIAGLGIGFVVIFFSTLNLIVATLALLTIAAVIVCVLGTLVYMGWQLGDIESICLMILAGFAVDYVVHLAHAYMESESARRLDRVADALGELGISVFWGMATSFFASIGLIMCLLQFFSRFGTFLMLTIVFAYFWAALFTMAVLAFIGPQPPKTSSIGPPPAASA